MRNPNIEILNKSELQNVSMTETKQTMPYKLFCLNHLNFCHLILFRISNFEFRIYRCILQKAKPIASDLAQRTRFFKMK